VHLVLVAGLWLDASSWDEVVSHLERAGHRTRALALPGTSEAADRSRTTLADAVAAVASAVDALDGPVGLVAHSAAGGVAHAAVDARPHRVAHVVYVGGFPTADGDPVAGDFPVVDGAVPLPDWSEFDEGDLAGLDEAARAAFRERAVPAPAYVVRDRQRLADERRYDVPVTMVATEYTTQMLRGWVEQGLAPVRELARIREVRYVDLPTGHWPQLTRPADLATVIREAASAA
jgi:pimeloyl-ACP methyl ester carboxylesterase